MSEKNGIKIGDRIRLLKQFKTGAGTVFPANSEGVVFNFCRSNGHSFVVVVLNGANYPVHINRRLLGDMFQLA